MKPEHNLNADSKPKDATRPLPADVTIDPNLAGKYDNAPFFQEKVNRANEILEKYGVPTFPEDSDGATGTAG